MDKTVKLQLRLGLSDTKMEALLDEKCMETCRKSGNAAPTFESTEEECYQFTLASARYSRALNRWTGYSGSFMALKNEAKKTLK